MPISTDWAEAWTLEDYTLDLFRKNLTQSTEFKLLVRIYGRDKLTGIWEKYRDKNRSKLKCRIHGSDCDCGGD